VVAAPEEIRGKDPLAPVNILPLRYFLVLPLLFYKLFAYTVDLFRELYCLLFHIQPGINTSPELIQDLTVANDCIFKVIDIIYYDQIPEFGYLPGKKKLVII